MKNARRKRRYAWADAFVDDLCNRKRVITNPEWTNAPWANSMIDQHGNDMPEYERRYRTYEDGINDLNEIPRLIIIDDPRGPATTPPKPKSNDAIFGCASSCKGDILIQKIIQDTVSLIRDQPLNPSKLL